MWKWNEICNTKKIILRLSTLVKEKPWKKCIIKKESTFKNESQALRNELQQTNESETLINESQALRNESQETVKNESHQTNESRKRCNNELQVFRKNQHKKLINTIKMVLKEFACKGFDTIITSKDKIILKSEQTSVKRYKECSTKITIGRDVITLKSLQLSNVYHARMCINEKK